ncbi:hypothetical protein C8R43DRAFT_95716 [Mycena crocata]|nr:hypothetical protein C8R43DRAFT_95716 [Mycena crocata]
MRRRPTRARMGASMGARSTGALRTLRNMRGTLRNTRGLRTLRTTSSRNSRNSSRLGTGRGSTRRLWRRRGIMRRLMSGRGSMGRSRGSMASMEAGGGRREGMGGGSSMAVDRGSSSMVSNSGSTASSSSRDTARNHTRTTVRSALNRVRARAAPALARRIWTAGWRGLRCGMRVRRVWRVWGGAVVGIVGRRRLDHHLPIPIPRPTRKRTRIRRSASPRRRVGAGAVGGRRSLRALRARARVLVRGGRWTRTRRSIRCMWGICRRYRLRGVLLVWEWAGGTLTLTMEYLEGALRELFSGCAGFRQMSFRPKGNGPMCFVEFDDVSYATKTLNELYGNTLNGLIKGGGIRLSYSKNPLGVRTPTSATATGTGASLAAQQQQGLAAAEAAFHPRLTSPPPPEFAPVFGAPAAAYPAPPRFFGAAPEGAWGRRWESAGVGVPRVVGSGSNSVVNGAAFSPFSHSPAPVEQAQGQEGEAQ